MKNKELRSLVEFRAVDDEDMIIEGKAVSFNSPTVLYEIDGIEYKEQISDKAFDDADMKDCCLKYNHSDSVPILARTRGGSLELEKKKDGLYFKARLFNTSVARDCYELVKQGALKCSFAFTIKADEYNSKERMRTIKEVDKLFDVSVVDIPAYDDTFASARSFFELEREKELLESRNEQKRKLALKLTLGGF